MKFSERVYEICKKIPKGRLSTYGEIGKAMRTKAYRSVGRALSYNPYAKVPCHIVLNSKVELHGFKGKKDEIALKSKKEILDREGIKFKGNLVVNFKNVFYKLR
ncbi:MGMT family protein [Candidatus Woesearchaeota archaeon]|nr:MGMT family protein [Candidatus Woesearchaeota archaeon]